MNETTPDDDPIVVAWATAFTAANGRPPDQMPRYESGWYVFRSSLGYVTGRSRREGLERMTARLKERANA